MEFLTQLIVAGLMSGAVYGLMAVGIILVYKSSGIFNFAHTAIVVMGAFVFWALITQLHLPFWLAVVLLLIWSLILGFLIQRLALRPLIGQPILAAIMATLALAEILNGIVTLIWPGLGRVYQPAFMPTGVIRAGNLVTISINQLASFVVCLVAFGIFTYFFQRTRIGLAMRATAEDQQLARSFGIKVERVLAISWVIAIITAAIGGILTACLYGVNPIVSEVAIYAFPAVIFGGLESITGGVIGGLALGVLQNIGAGYLDPFVGGGLKELAPYIILLLVLIFKPYGLFGYERIERI